MAFPEEGDLTVEDVRAMTESEISANWVRVCSALEADRHAEAEVDDASESQAERDTTEPLSLEQAKKMSLSEYLSRRAEVDALASRGRAA